MNWTTMVALANGTADEYDDMSGTEESVACRSTFGDRFPLSAVLMVFCMVTVFGNCLVIIAVVRERYLHTATNYFITSLAFADFLVGLVVMPVSAVQEVLDHYWTFGINACDVWRSLDVLFSTASILNLCVISLDRYWAITDPFTYPTKMSRKRAYRLIAAVWVCSGVISFPAIIWWRLVRTEPVPSNTCPFTNSTGSTRRPSRRPGARGWAPKCCRPPRRPAAVPVACGGAAEAAAEAAVAAAPAEADGADAADTPGGGTTTSASAAGGGGYTRAHQLQKNFSLSRKLSKLSREKKAAKTLGIVMGVFIVCWLPFFVVNLLSGFCDESCVFKDQLLSSVVAWLGWINSGMNPVIYACWSRDFRR
ncbi:hypothetical protein AGLY_005969 [Aphis glycines]|uniref:G-protein coupled receptors family 1 profile domain-containing protein n=1 Tax=Aphis glycines TaxID=307491 RepID=A0A6G0TSV3_APHGL|nr:hypothetical protein AGLY_005969 [Aphis glycines]